MSKLSKLLFPLAAENAIYEAGGSAYRWYIERVAESSGISIEKVQKQQRAGASLIGLFIGCAITFASLAHGEFPVGLVLAAVVVTFLFGVNPGVSRAYRIWELLGAVGAIAALVFAGWPAFLTYSIFGAAIAVALIAPVRWIGLSAYTSTFFVALGVFQGNGDSMAWLAALFGLGAIYPVVRYYQKGRIVNPFVRSGALTKAPLSAPEWAVPAPLIQDVRKFEKQANSERKRGARAVEKSRIDIKKVGAMGERKTALTLLGIHRSNRAAIMHDVVIPGAGSGANADTILMGIGGGLVIDTKKFGSEKKRAKIYRDGNDLVQDSGNGPQSLSKTLCTLAWAVNTMHEASGGFPFEGLLVAQSTDLTPVSVIVPGRYGEPDAVITVISVDDVVAYVNAMPPVCTLQSLAVAQHNTRRRLRSATSGRLPHISFAAGTKKRDELPYELRALPDSPDFGKLTKAQQIKNLVEDTIGFWLPNLLFRKREEAQ